MRLTLKEPFASKYRLAYLRIRSSDKRKIVDLYNSETDRTSISYARYLASVAAGRFLTESEHADHKDDDRTNDHPDNIQILASKENILKSTERGRESVMLKCFLCKKEFKREVRQVKKTLFHYCSRVCRDLCK